MTVKYVKAMPKLTDVKTIAHSSFWGSSSTLRFRNFRPPPPPLNPVRAHTLLAYTPSP